jgi:hypothetical protein
MASLQERKRGVKKKKSKKGLEKTIGGGSARPSDTTAAPTASARAAVAGVSDAKVSLDLCGILGAYDLTKSGDASTADVGCNDEDAHIWDKNGSLPLKQSTLGNRVRCQRVNVEHL